MTGHGAGVSTPSITSGKQADQCGSLSNRMWCFPTIWSREHTHKERKASGIGTLNHLTSLLESNTSIKEPVKASGEAALLLYFSLSNRDYLENPAVLMLERCSGYQQERGNCKSTYGCSQIMYLRMAVGCGLTWWSCSCNRKLPL